MRRDKLRLTADGRVPDEVDANGQSLGSRIEGTEVPEGRDEVVPVEPFLVDVHDVAKMQTMSARPIGVRRLTGSRTERSRLRRCVVGLYAATRACLVVR